MAIKAASSADCKIEQEMAKKKGKGSRFSEVWNVRYFTETISGTIVHALWR